MRNGPLRAPEAGANPSSRTGWAKGVVRPDRAASGLLVAAQPGASGARPAAQRPGCGRHLVAARAQRLEPRRQLRFERDAVARGVADAERDLRAAQEAVSDLDRAATPAREPGERVDDPLDARNRARAARRDPRPRRAVALVVDDQQRAVALDAGDVEESADTSSPSCANANGSSRRTSLAAASRAQSGLRANASTSAATAARSSSRPAATPARAAAAATASIAARRGEVERLEQRVDRDAARGRGARPRRRRGRRRHPEHALQVEAVARSARTRRAPCRRARRVALPRTLGGGEAAAVAATPGRLICSGAAAARRPAPARRAARRCGPRSGA